LLEKSLNAARLNLLRLVAEAATRDGLPLYIVGGSVRDLLLGRLIKDFDFTVEGEAAKLAEALLRKYAGKIVFHSRFGTATWTLDDTTFKRLNVPLLGSSSFPPFLDFISARSETYSKPGSLPTVKRSTIDDDLHRRDFTINAMALRLDGLYYGELYDPLGGRADLEGRLVKVLHDGSFVDDPTRMLRAVRYAGRYGFEIDPGTLTLVNEEARDVLSHLSGERLRHEIDLIFEETNPSATLHRLGELGLLRPIHAALEHANFQLPVLDILPSEFGEITIPDVLSFKRILGWILWLMPLTRFDIEVISKRLDFPAQLTKAALAASSLLAGLPASVNRTPSQWTYHLEEIPSISVYAVYLMRKEPALRDYLIHWRHIKATVTGNDLIERGLEPGPRYAEILRQLRTAWLDGDVKTQAEEILFLDKLIQ
jgi:tRNA nucleotidyltransferase (CCA-adding enzyme)